MIQLDGPGWKRAEQGFFFFDIGGAVIVLTAMLAVLVYINVQMSYMADLEGNITADYLAREQLDILCIEQNPGDLGNRTVEENNHTFQVMSIREAGMLEGLLQYRVVVEWQDRRGAQRIDVSKNVLAKTADGNREAEQG